MNDLGEYALKSRTSEDELRAVLVNVPDLIVLIDREGRIVHLNRVPAQFTNINLIGENFLKVANPQNQKLYYKAFEDVIKTGKTIYIKTIARDHTGRNRWWESRWMPVTRAGVVENVLVIVSDVTEQVENEQKVKKSERLLADIFTCIQDGLTILDTEMNILQVNPIVETWYAHKIPLAGKKCYDVFHNREMRCEVCPTRKTLATGQAAYEVVPKTGPGGQIVGWLDLYSFPLIDTTSGKLKGIIEYTRDITERRRAEDALRDSEAKYRSFFESTVTAVGMADGKGNFSEVNDAWSRLFGYSRTDFFVVNFSTLFPDPSTYAQLIQRVILEGKIQNQELIMRRKNEEEFWISLSIQLLQLKGEHRFLITGIDINANKQAEQNLQNLYQTSLQISEMKSNLITFASHELKTPLIPILGWIDYLKKNWAKGHILNQPDTNEIIESVLRSAQRLERIIDNFLDIGRIDQGLLEIQAQSHSLAKLMQNALDAVASVAQVQNIRFHNQIEDFPLCVDGFRIEQVFINILSNAVKYSNRDKEVTITSRIDSDKLLISITDQGYGFLPEELHDIWQPFSANFLQKTNTSFIPGTGIGLYLSKMLVERHGGQIEIVSPGKDQGSTVKIWLPLAQFSEKCPP